MYLIIGFGVEKEEFILHINFSLYSIRDQFDANCHNFLYQEFGTISIPKLWTTLFHFIFKYGCGLLSFHHLL